MVVDRLLGSLMLIEQSKLHALIAKNIGGDPVPTDAPSASQGPSTSPDVGDGAFNENTRLPQGLDGRSLLDRAPNVPASQTLLGLRPVALAMIANASASADPNALANAQNWSKTVFANLTGTAPVAPESETGSVADGQGESTTSATDTRAAPVVKDPVSPPILVRDGGATTDGSAEREAGSDSGEAPAGRQPNAGSPPPTGLSGATALALNGLPATEGAPMDGNQTDGLPADDPAATLAMQQSGRTADIGSRPDLARARPAAAGTSSAAHAVDSAGLAEDTGDVSAKKAGLAGELSIKGSTAEINRLEAARKLLDVALPDGLDLLAAAPTRGDGQSERAGIIDSFILNAAMIPGWPFPKPIELAGKRALIPDTLPNGLSPPDETEALTYLANMGARRSLLARIRDQVRKLTRRLKILMGLAVLMTAVSLALRTLQEELEALEDECLELEKAATRGWRTLVG